MSALSKYALGLLTVLTLSQASQAAEMKTLSEDVRKNVVGFEFDPANSRCDVRIQGDFGDITARCTQSIELKMKDGSILKAEDTSDGYNDRDGFIPYVGAITSALSPAKKEVATKRAMDRTYEKLQGLVQANQK